MLRREHLGENLLVCRETRQRDIQASVRLRVLAHVQNDLSADRIVLAQSSARLQLACGMAVSFNHSRLSAFTRVHAIRELHVTASTQSKCLSVTGGRSQGCSTPTYRPLSQRRSSAQHAHNLPAAWRQVSTSENHQAAHSRGSIWLDLARSST